MRTARRPARAASDAPSAAAAHRLDSARLRPPRQGSGNDRLHHHDVPGLDDAPALLLLSAPAGYGKSALLSACYHRHGAAGGRVGWLTLDREDSDPDRLAEMLSRALAEGDAPLPVAAGTARMGLLRLLEGDLPTTDGGPIRIFLDGFDQIAGTAAAGLLGDLIDRCQDGVRWVVATRPVSLRDIVHLRARGMVKLVDGAALRLPPSTYAAVLGRPITAQEQDAIDAAVEGWPIALRALRLELDAGIDVREALSRIGAPGSLVDDYISAELLPSLLPATVDFLCRASILGQFDAPTVDLLFGRADSHLRLGTLDPLSPLASPSPSGGWRLNPILAQHLEHGFDQRSDIDVADRRMAAFGLLAERGDYVGAIRNALKAGGAREAARLIGDAGVLRLWTELGFEPMLAIVRMLPPALGAHQPSLRFCDALSLFDAGRTTSAIRLLDTIRADVLRDFRSDQKTTSRFELEWIAIRAILGLVREVVREEVLNQLPFSATTENGSLTEILSFVHVLLWAVAHQQWGELDDADRMVSQAEQAAPPKSAAFNGYFFAIYRGWIAAARGDARRAIDNYRRIAKSEEGGSLRCLGEAMVAEAHYMQGDFASASGQIERWLPPLEQSQAWFDFFSAAFVTAALLALRNDGLPAALAVVERMQIVARDRQSPSLMRLVAPLKLSLLMRGRALKTARTHETEHQLHAACRDLSRDQRQSSWRERDLLRGTMAEFYIHTGRTREARQSIQLLLEDAEATGRMPARLTGLVLRSVLLWRQGNRDGALSLLAKAIEDAIAGDQRGMIRDREHLVEPMLEPLRREGPPLTPDARSFLDAMIAAYREREKSRPGRLTQREREVIAFVEAGHTNKQIARSLSISENTVKFHLKRIAVKLDRVGSGRVNLTYMPELH